MKNPITVLLGRGATGRHRTGTPAPLINLPMDAEPGEFAPCPAEERETYHAVHADGSRTCWTCKSWTEAGA
jgi:hypothetical protein